MYQIGKYTIERDRREDHLWLVYPTKEGQKLENTMSFSTEIEAIEFAEYVD